MPSEWYRQIPFDPDITFSVSGQLTRHVNHPLDETYVTDVGFSYVDGSLPPEDREVRDHLINIVLRETTFRGHDTSGDRSVSKSDKKAAFHKAWSDLESLASKAGEYRAAMMRLSRVREMRSDHRDRLRKLALREAVSDQH